MIVQNLEKQLLNLTPIEKAEIIQLLTQSIDANWCGISKTSNVMGGDSCISGTRIPIWLLASYRQQGLNDAGILEAYPQLNAANLVNAWAYAAAYPEEIAEAIRQQEEADRILDTPEN